jgi:hypothetical protein
MTLCLFHEISLEIMFVFAHGAYRQSHRQPHGQPGDVRTVGDRHAKQIKPSGN